MQSKEIWYWSYTSCTSYCFSFDKQVRDRLERGRYWRSEGNRWQWRRGDCWKRGGLKNYQNIEWGARNITAFLMSLWLISKGLSPSLTVFFSAQIRKNDFIKHIKQSNLMTEFKQTDPSSDLHWQKVICLAFRSLPPSLYLLCFIFFWNSMPS